MSVMIRTRGEKAFSVVNVIALLLLCLATLYPFANVLAISLSGMYPVLRGEVTVFPIDITLDAYRRVIESGAILNAYKNTLFVVGVGTLLSVIFTAFAAYPLSKKELPGRTAMTFIIAFTMWFSAGMIPGFFVIKGLHLLDKLWALILAPLVSAFNVVIMRTFFMNIPDSLEEAACIDGCGYGGTLFRIVLPLSKPVLATVALWVAVAHWNSFMSPLLYISTRSKLPVQVVLRDIVLANSVREYGLELDPNNDEFQIVPESIQTASIIFSTLPILCFYPFLQKYFTKGVMIGSIKG